MIDRKFVKIKDLICTDKGESVRPLYEGFLYHLGINNLAKVHKNILEIKFESNYFEYVQFQFENGLFEITASFYREVRIDLKIPKVFDIDLNECAVHFFNFQNVDFDPKKYLADYFAGYLKNFLVMDCLPYSVGIIDGEKTVNISKQYTTVPLSKKFQLKNIAGKIKFLLSSVQDKVIKEISFEKANYPDSTSVFYVDSNFVRSFVLPSGEKVLF